MDISILSSTLRGTISFSINGIISRLPAFLLIEGISFGTIRGGVLFIIFHTLESYTLSAGAIGSRIFSTLWVFE